jgi:hypothetical protein
MSARLQTCFTVLRLGATRSLAKVLVGVAVGSFQAAAINVVPGGAAMRQLRQIMLRQAFLKRL